MIDPSPSGSRAGRPGRLGRLGRPGRLGRGVLVVALVAGLGPATAAGAAPRSGSAPAPATSVAPAPAAGVDAPDVPAPVALTAADAAVLDVTEPRDRVLVWWEAATSTSRRTALLGAVRDRIELAEGVEAVQVPTGRAAALAATLAGRPEVVAVTVDRVIETAAARPDDPLFSRQWGLDNPGTVAIDSRRARTGLDVRALRAWQVTRGRPTVTVAVVDTGVDPQHPDLVGALWRNPRERLDGRDTDGNGFVDDLHGWDFVRGGRVVFESPATDQHGTAVAGVIAARADDGVGMAGVAPEVRVMAVRAFRQDPTSGVGQGTMSTVVPALLYAVRNGADVINASWVTVADDPMLRQVVAQARVPVVAAAGNGDANGVGFDVATFGRAFPAAYDLPNLVTVTAVDHTGAMPRFANFGRPHVHLGAPGVGVVAPQAGGGHQDMRGTSFAAPFVSGALALARSAAPYATTADLVDAVERTTRVEASLVGRTTTGGILDADALVRGVQRPVCRPDLQPRAGFSDVPRVGTHTAAIDCLVARGVARGTTATTFHPARTVSRGQMATFLVRVLEEAGVVLPPVAGQRTFRDTAGHAHGDAAERLAAAGITLVGPDRRFRPDDDVTRGQMATFLARTHALADGRTRSPSRRWFPDTAGSTHDAAVSISRDLGVVRGVERLRYAPGQPVRREQMASFLARLLDSLGREGVVEVPSDAPSGTSDR